MIELKQVTSALGGKRLFEACDFAVEAAERVVIMGESGSGKTTLLRLIAGFQAPDAGEIALDGEPVSRAGRIVIPPHRRHVSMVFQDLALWPHMNVFENVAFGLRVRKLPLRTIESDVKRMLAEVGLDGFEARRIETLSGGERQRVALARALVVSPKILLMDEPLSSLDPERVRTMCDLIVSLHGQMGFTLLYVSHRFDEAERIATRTVTLRKGCLQGAIT